MPEKRITVIDWKAENTTVSVEPRSLRVAAYARVSTEKESQENSMEAQKQYFQEYISTHENWIYVGVYADKGHSGLSYQKRPGFCSMLQDALDGKIDHIVVKSLSRFARNTVDSLTVIRQLKAKGVSVYFQKENINTLDGSGEFLITLMSSFAEEESRSISENVKWALRLYFSQGKYSVPFGHFLGYDRGTSGEFVINEEEAKTVRYIYLLALQGYSGIQICKILSTQGIPAPFGSSEWWDTTITSILSNEKYIGDARLQKTVTTDFITKAKKKNTGEAPQYYVESGHDPIIDRDVWTEIQDSWVNDRSKYPTINPFSGNLVCDCCGGKYGKKVWHSTTTHDVVWECNRKKSGKAVCNNVHIYDYELWTAALSAFAKLLHAYDSCVKNCISNNVPEENMDSVRNHLRTAVRDGSFFDDFSIRLLLRSIHVTQPGVLLFEFIDGSHFRYHLKEKTPNGQAGIAARKKNHAQIIELHQLGLKPSEIAKQLGISRNTVKSYLRRNII